MHLPAGCWLLGVKCSMTFGINDKNKLHVGDAMDALSLDELCVVGLTLYGWFLVAGNHGSWQPTTWLVGLQAQQLLTELDLT